jgi:hypothetical protein
MLCRLTILHPNERDPIGRDRLDDSLPLKAELADAYDYFTAPIRLDRKGAMRTDSTVMSYAWTISSYMGYLVRFKGIALEHLSLELYTNQWLWLCYAEYKLQKPNVKQSINNVVAHTKAVSCTVEGHAWYAFMRASACYRCYRKVLCRACVCTACPHRRLDGTATSR